MSNKEIEQVWEQDAKTRLSRIKRIAEQADSMAEKQLRQQVTKLIKAKAEPEHDPVSELPGTVIKNFWEGCLEGAPDNEFTRRVKEEYSKIKAKSALQENRLVYDTDDLLKAVSTMKAVQLYQIAKDLYAGKTIEEIRNQYAMGKAIILGT